MSKPKKAKRLSNPTSTSGEGGRFESRVQASYLLALLTGDNSRLGGNCQIIELRFQGRIHGFATDDLVCTIQRDDGSTFTAAIQIKLTLRARASDGPFKDALTDAWSDYSSNAKFQKGVDRLAVAYSRDAGRDTVHSAGEVCSKARAATNAADFLKSATAEHYSSPEIRDALAAIRAVLDLAAASAVSDDDLYGFCRHLWFLEHRLASDDTPDVANLLREIGWALGRRAFGGPVSVWSVLVTTAQRLNTQAATVRDDTLRGQFDSALLVNAFERHRLSDAGADVIEVQPGAARREALDESLPIGAVRAPTGGLLLDNDGLGEGQRESANRMVTAQLDAVNDLIKALRYKDAQSQITTLGQDQTLFDDYQKSRWHLLSATCHWHLGAPKLAAEDFLKAYELFPDDERNAAAHIRGLLLAERLTDALEAGQAAKARFPSSLFVWAAHANAEIISGLVPDEARLPPEHNNSADALQLIAAGLHKAGRLRESAEVSLRSLTADKPGFYVRAAALAHVLDLVAQNNVHTALRVLSAGDRDMLKAVSDAFEPRAERIWAIQADDAVSVAAANLGTALLLQGRPEEALEVGKEARAQQRSRAELLRVELEALHDTGQVDAMFSVGLANLLQLQDGGLVAMAQVAANRGRPEVATQIWEHASSRNDLDTEVKEVLKATRWLALWNVKQRSVVAQELQALVVSEVQSLPMLATVARLARQSDKAKSEAALQRALVKAGDKPPPEQRLLLADLWMDLKEFDKAARLYESVLPAEGVGELHARLLNSYLRAGNRRKASELLAKLQDGWARDDELRAMAADLARDAGDWPLLAQVAAAQFERNPSDIGSWLFKYMVDSRELAAADVKEFIAQAPLELTGSIQQTVQLAVLEFKLGLHPQGMKRLYRMRRLHAANIESASGLMMGYLAYNEPVPGLHDNPQTLEPGVHATLEGPTGITHMTLDPEGLTGLPDDPEFRPRDAAAVQEFLGKAVGQEVSLDTGFGGPRTYRVVALDTSYLRQLTLAHSQVESSVEPTPNLWMVPVRSAPDGDFDFSKVHEELKRQSQKMREALKSYQDLPFTLGGLGRLTGNSAVDLVQGWPSDLGADPLRVCDGNFDELERARAALIVEGQAFLIDAPTLAELVRLDAVDALAVLGEVYATSETEEVLRVKHDSLHDKGPEGRLLDDNGQMRFVEIPPKAQEYARKQAQAAVDALRRYCKVVPAYGPESKPEFFKHVERILSPEERSVLEVALERKLCLISTDLRLRGMAAEMKIPGAWPQVLLQFAVSKGALSAQQYSASVQRLLLANRAFVSIDAEALWAMCLQGTDWVRFGLARLKVYLASPTLDFASTFDVIKKFVVLALLRGLRLVAMQELLRHLCEGVMRHPQATPDAIDELLNDMQAAIASQRFTPYRPLVAIEARRAAEKFRFLAQGVVDGVQWAKGEPEHRPVQLAVYFVTKRPLLMFEPHVSPEGAQGTGDEQALIGPR